ncbi:AhpD-like protein [Biscogniauxia mediterranea]|nr:AhpD-like protein [Biscogniauxia mediterranea]
MRIPYTPDPPPTTTPEDAAIVSRVAARRAPRPLQPLDLALLHAPPVADGWNAFLGAVRGRTSLHPALRELAICRVAVCNRAWYEWAHHAPLAREAGVGERGMAVVRREVLGEEEGKAGGDGGDGGDGKGDDRRGGLGEREWAVLRYADEMTRKVRVGDGLFEEMRALFSEREIVEITATVAAYNCVSRFLVALDVGERNNTGPDDVASH